MSSFTSYNSDGSVTTSSDLALVSGKPTSSSNGSERSASVKTKSSFYLGNVTELDSPDGLADLPRDSIASGATSLPARESMVRHQLLVREKEYTDLKPFTIFIGSWNVNGQVPSVSLGVWLAGDDEPPDIYAIGFQELDLSKEAFVFADSPREQEWLLAVAHSLHPGAKYTKLKLIRLVGMMLVVFVKSEHVEFISSIQAETVGTGLLGKMGNKGGVAVRFDFHNTSLCFVNCHLAAHVEEFERRNQDYTEILSRMIFSGLNSPKLITNHDQIYWFGDLNYRITQITTDEVKKILDVRCFEKLLQFDQLRIQQEAKKVFVGYEEGPIKHMPTYKYDTGSDNWDSSEKNRPPAWCDRILWRGGPSVQKVYRSHPELKISDHKPVSSIFESSVKVINQVKYRKMYENVMKKLDRMENEFQPQVTVDKMEISYGLISFREPFIETLTIANTGQVPARFEFTIKPNHTSYCKPWLFVTPYTATITPGETLEVELKVHVDRMSASDLNAGRDTINDILVLHLEHGRDIFITISGEYKPSCFGSSIEALVRLREPVDDTDPKFFRQVQDPGTVPLGADPCWDIPKEVWLLVDQLYKYGMEQGDLFQQPGLLSEFKEIRNALDAGWPEKLPGGVHSIAEALLLIIEAFSEPVIPFHLYQRALDAAGSFVECKKVIAELPTCHRNVFYNLVAFMRELLRHSNYNKLDQKILASLFGTILIRARGDGSAAYKQLLASRTTSAAAAQYAIDKKKSHFVYNFLVNDFDV